MGASSQLVATCDCKRTFHTHGDQNMYRRHGCRCEPCRKAALRKRKYAQVHHPKLGANKYDVIDATDCKKAIGILLKQGWSYNQIAVAAGIPGSAQHVCRIYLHKSRVTKYTQARIANAYKKLNKAHSGSSAKVSGEPASRCLQALATNGWTIAAIIRHTDATFSRQYLDHIRSGRQNKVTLATHQKVMDIYYQLRFKQCNDANSVPCRTIAKRNGWKPVGYWEDIVKGIPAEDEPLMNDRAVMGRRKRKEERQRAYQDNQA